MTYHERRTPFDRYEGSRRATRTRASEDTSVATMVMTILEAHVAPEQWSALEQAYQQARGDLPAQMVETFLVHSVDEPLVWRGISVWHSREALDEYRRSTEVPGGVLMFRAVGAEPTL